LHLSLIQHVFDEIKDAFIVERLDSGVSAVAR